MSDPAGIERDRIEGEAERVLAGVPGWMWDGRSLPVPIESITDSHLMLLVRDVEDMSSAPGLRGAEVGSVSGLLLTALGEIWVSAEEARKWPTRRRFTIGHELGHWVLHADGESSMFCRFPSVAEGGSTRAAEGDRGRTHTEDPEAVLGGDFSAGHEVSQLTETEALSEAEANLFAASILMPRDLFKREHRRLNGEIERLCDRFGSSEKATRRRIEAVVE